MGWGYGGVLCGRVDVVIWFEGLEVGVVMMRWGKIGDDLGGFVFCEVKVRGCEEMCGWGGDLG